MRQQHTCVRAADAATAESRPLRSSVAVSVAPLRLVSPGAATDGVTLFFLQKTNDLFSALVSGW